MLLLSVKCNKVLRRTLHWMCVCNLTSVIVYELQVYLNENTRSSYFSSLLSNIVMKLSSFHFFFATNVFKTYINVLQCEKSI